METLAIKGFMLKKTRCKLKFQTSKMTTGQWRNLKINVTKIVFFWILVLVISTLRFPEKKKLVVMFKG